MVGTSGLSQERSTFASMDSSQVIPLGSDRYNQMHYITTHQDQVSKHAGMRRQFHIEADFSSDMLRDGVLSCKQ